MSETARWAYLVYPCASIVFFVAVELFLNPPPSGSSRIPLWLTGLFIALLSTFTVVASLVGREAALSWASDFVPFAFAVAGCAFSIKKVREEHQFAILMVLMIIGVLGCVVFHLARTHEQDRLFAASQMTNDLLVKLNKSTTKPMTAEEAATERMRDIEKTLTAEYILANKDIPAGVLAGTELPPREWMNKRLSELGEPWRISEPSKPSLPTLFPPAPTIGNLKERTLQLSQDVMDMAVRGEPPNNRAASFHYEDPELNKFLETVNSLNESYNRQREILSQNGKLFTIEGVHALRTYDIDVFSIESIATRLRVLAGYLRE